MHARPGETIAALATPPGAGAVAIVRISGPETAALAAVLCGPVTLPPRVATRVRLRDPMGATLDRALALWFPGPASYTGEDVLELHVHGSTAVAGATLIAALAAGARLATPGEFTRRAYLHGKLDLLAAEAVADTIAAEDRSAARAAVARLSGGLATRVEGLRVELAELLERLAATLDFPDEVPEPDRDACSATLGGIEAALGELTRDFERGRLVREGVSIAIVGAPNAGKSTLLNALLGSERALVSEEPGTTRDTIEERVALGPFSGRLIDTAGLREGAGPLEAAGIARSRRALAEVRVALVVVDAADLAAARAVAPLLAETRGRARVVFFTKADLGRGAYDARAEPEAAALLGSARRTADVEGLRTALAAAASGGAAVDLERPFLATARQADEIWEASRALGFARATLAAGDAIDLVAPDLFAASAALGRLTGREATEAVIDAIFARFCIGK